MRPPYLRDWKGEQNTVAVTDAATPLAESALLISADQAVMEVATTPYCGCGHVYEGGTTGLGDRYFGVVVAAGAEHCRVALSNAFGDTTTATTANTWWTTDGGTAGADINTVPSPHIRTRVYVPTEIQVADVTESGGWDNDTPAATSDRWGELQSLLVSYVEAMYVRQACGVSMHVVEQAADLEAL